jgi:hypothetical protein
MEPLYSYFHNPGQQRMIHTSGTAPSTTAWTWGWTEKERMENHTVAKGTANKWMKLLFG